MTSIADRLKSIKSTVNPSFGHSSEDFESVPGHWGLSMTSWKETRSMERNIKETQETLFVLQVLTSFNMDL